MGGGRSYIWAGLTLSGILSISGVARAQAAPPSALTPIHFESEPPGITLHLQEPSTTDSGSRKVEKDYRLLCTAPCDAKIPAGAQTLALAGDDGVARPTRALLFPERPVVVRGHFESRATLRYIGVLVALASIGTGVYFIVSSNNGTTSCSGYGCGDAPRQNNTALGILIGLVGGGGGILLARLPDVPAVDVVTARAKPLPVARTLTFTSHF